MINIQPFYHRGPQSHEHIGVSPHWMGLLGSTMISWSCFSINALLSNANGFIDSVAPLIKRNQDIKVMDDIKHLRIL
jgi:hypothetical protein